MKIRSIAFEDSQLIPPIYSKEGQNINPPLEFSEVPENAQSLALIMDDPDAPGGVFTHWLIWNMSPDIREIPENSFPSNAEQGLNGRGSIGYTGPYPPAGTHRYFFKLYALNKRLNVTPNVGREELEEEINNSLIEKAQLTGLYQKQNNGSV